PAETTVPTGKSSTDEQAQTTPEASKDESTLEVDNVKPDDLKKIEGIGPKIAEKLNEAGITTFSKLAGTDISDLKLILENAGSRYKMHDPTTWPQQSELAATGEWDALKKLQDELDGGRK
ncbi:MAG: helix-hairpin-helix domain-containing protein, partial [Bacteroidota bacterium]